MNEASITRHAGYDDFKAKVSALLMAVAETNFTL